MESEDEDFVTQALPEVVAMATDLIEQGSQTFKDLPRVLATLQHMQRLLINEIAPHAALVESSRSSALTADTEPMSDWGDAVAKLAEVDMPIGRDPVVFRAAALIVDLLHVGLHLQVRVDEIDARRRQPVGFTS